MKRWPLIPYCFCKDSCLVLKYSTSSSLSGKRI